MRSRGHVENEVRVVSESVACAFDLDDDGVAAVHVGAVALAGDARQFLWAISQDFRKRQVESASGTSSGTDSKRRGAAGRKRAPPPRSPPDAASKTCVGPTFSIGGLVVQQPGRLTKINGMHPSKG